MVKITTRALKIGVQSRFYPISTVGFRTFFPENFGQAYYSGAFWIGAPKNLGWPKVGLAKIFGEKSAKPHGGNWVKT